MAIALDHAGMLIEIVGFVMKSYTTKALEFPLDSYKPSLAKEGCTVRRILYRLSMFALYAGPFCTGITGVANAETQFEFSQSAQVVGAITASVRGDGGTGLLPASHFTGGNHVEMSARAQGAGEIIVRIRGPRGFNLFYNLELDPLIPKSIFIKFVPSDHETNGQTSYSETDGGNRINAVVGFNTNGFTGQLSLSASCSGSLTECSVILDDVFGNDFQTVAVANGNACCGPGHGRLGASSVLDVEQDE
jgi:hypothetical protein